MKKIAIIFAAGTGTRMNSARLPKPFLEVNGCPIVIYTVRWFQNHDEIDEIIVVCSKAWVRFADNLMRNYGITKARVVEGGASAMESQYKGICAAKENSKEAILLLHDGVRPLINHDLITACIRSVENKGSAVVTAKTGETIMTVSKEQRVSSVIKRSECTFGRAPQCFFMSKLIEMHDRAKTMNMDNIVDSASLFFHFGEPIYTIEGPAENIKLTTPSDYFYFKAMIDARESLQFTTI